MNIYFHSTTVYLQIIGGKSGGKIETYAHLKKEFVKTVDLYTADITLLRKMSNIVGSVVKTTIQKQIARKKDNKDAESQHNILLNIRDMFPCMTYI